MAVTRKATMKALEMCGWSADTSAKTKKYVVYRKLGSERVYLVGKSGALRVLPVGTALDKSVSLTGNLWHRALCEVVHFRVDGPVEATDLVERIYDSLKAKGHSHATT